MTHLRLGSWSVIGIYISLIANTIIGNQIQAKGPRHKEYQSMTRAIRDGNLRNWPAAVFAILFLVEFPAIGAAAEQPTSDDLWSRTKRVFTWDAPHRARYPSIERTVEGELIVLFTSISQEQEKTGVGELMLLRSSDDGGTWSDPVSVYVGQQGEPRSMGSLTRLPSSGPYSEVKVNSNWLGPSSVTSAVSSLSRLYCSGTYWTYSSTIVPRIVSITCLPD